MIRELIDTQIKAYSKKYAIDFDILSALVQIESNFNPTVIGDGGRSFGLTQIMRGGALTEYEKQKGVTITDQEALNISQNLKIGFWYFCERIPEYLKKYNHEDTITNRIIAYNAGIGNLNKGIVPQITKDYISKMEKISGINLNPKKVDSFFFNCPCCASVLDIKINVR